MLDLLIKNARIIDGTGSEGYLGWIGVRMEEIVSLEMGACKRETELEAQQVIDAKGMILCPGFIDIHSHGDISLISHSFSPEKIWQGVTTQTIGHCGISAAPFSEAWGDFLTQSLLGQMGAGGKGKSFGDYIGFLSQRELGTNVAPLVGYAPIRMAVRGSSPEEPDRKELKMMAELLDEAMRAGSFGFTTGLAYPPQCQATTDELAALCEVVAHYGGIYATHVRDIIYDIISGLKEAIEIGRRSGVRIHIAHLQVRPNPYYNLQDVLSLMEKARQEGIEVTCDHYDYLAGQGPLTPIFPAWALGGGVEAIQQRLKNDQDRKRIKQYMREIVEQYFEWSDVILWMTDDETLIGKSIQTLAHIEEKDPRDVVMDVLLKNGLSTGALFFGKTEKDLCSAAAWKHSVAGTDGIFFENQRQNHPRTFGTFPRMIRKYVRELNVFTIEEAIHRMSGMTAEILGLSDRGVLAKGKRADILIFDPQLIKDTATYEEPFSKAQGIELVVVNGKIVKSGDNDFPITAGRVLNLNRAET